MYSVSMSDDTILAELDQLAAHHETQARKYRAALKLLRGPQPAIASITPRPTVSRILGPRKSPTSTMSMIRKVLASSERALVIPELTERMLSGGWDTQSENPSNTVRTAILRLVDKTEVIRNADGTFELTPSDEINILQGASDGDESRD